MLANLAHYLEVKLEAIANNKKVLSAGKVVMVRRVERSKRAIRLPPICRGAIIKP